VIHSLQWPRRNADTLKHFLLSDPGVLKQQRIEAFGIDGNNMVTRLTYAKNFLYLQSGCEIFFHKHYFLKKTFLQKTENFEKKVF